MTNEELLAENKRLRNKLSREERRVRKLKKRIKELESKKGDENNGLYIEN